MGQEEIKNDILLACLLVFLYDYIVIKKILFFGLLLAFCCKLSASPSLAKDFSSFYKVTYEFNQKGEALVNQEISLINKVGNLYVSQYSLSVMGGQISDVKAFDKIGPLKINTEVKGQTTIIGLNFNEKVVGVDKILSFIFKYKVSGLAEKEGSLWQVSIPKLANAEEIDEFKLLVRVPFEYGRISVANPNPQEQTSVQDYYQFTFNKESVKDFGVLLTFGQSQSFDFKINYSLKNEKRSPLVEKIALPPDSAYQTITYFSIIPEPKEVEVDEDGNWLASYHLDSGEELQIVAEGQVKVLSQPQKWKNRTKDFSLDKDYLSATKFWEVDEKVIIDLANTLKTPENIYQYVVKKLTYNYQEVKEFSRQRGALSALQNPADATCTQFTDLFITLARAAGIPSREIEGFAYTNNPILQKIADESDLLHSWPQYYDRERKEWIMIDPTWGKTTGGLDYFNKFDMSHFTFVIHGKSDLYPFPPGSYKERGSVEKQIFVTVGKETSDEKKLTFELIKLSPLSINSSKRNNMVVYFRNSSGMALYGAKLVAESGDFLKPENWFFEVIPPYGKFKIDFSLKPKELLKDYSREIVFKLNDVPLKKSIEIKSLLLRVSLIVGVIFTLFLFLLLYQIKKSSYKKRGESVIIKDRDILD